MEKEPFHWFIRYSMLQSECWSSVFPTRPFTGLWYLPSLVFCHIMYHSIKNTQQVPTCFDNPRPCKCKNINRTNNLIGLCCTPILVYGIFIFEARTVPCPAFFLLLVGFFSDLHWILEMIKANDDASLLRSSLYALTLKKNRGVS